MTELLLIQMYQGQLARQVPAPSREEVDKYISAHPDLYAARKVFTVDQVRMARPADNTLIDALRPLTSMEDVVAMLAQRNIPFQRGGDKIDAVRVGPQIAEQVTKLPPNEVFVIPVGNLLTVNRILQTETVPFTGEPAATQASQAIKNQRIQEAVTRQIGSVVTASKKDIVYNKAYQPAAPAKAAPKAAPKAP